MNAISWPSWSPPGVHLHAADHSAATTPKLSVSIMIGIVTALVRTALMF